MSLFSEYSLNNLFLIAKQRPAAKRVAGYQTWRKLGCFVRKGEKGIAIIAPMVRRKHDEENLEPTENESWLAGFKVAHAFSEEQTEGSPLPEIAQVSGDAGYYLSRLEEFVRPSAFPFLPRNPLKPHRRFLVPLPKCSRSDWEQRECAY
jgi:antirestriction protein ArdC